jgi:hypothetical protein
VRACALTRQAVSHRFVQQVLVDRTAKNVVGQL